MLWPLVGLCVAREASVRRAIGNQDDVHPAVFFSSFRCARSRAGYYARSVDTFLTRQKQFRVSPSVLCQLISQALGAARAWRCITDDDNLRLRIGLQAHGNVVEDALANVVNARAPEFEIALRS